MRVVAIMAVHNEQRFIARALSHLIGQGLLVYLLDNDSSDNTRDLAAQFLGRGLMTIEPFLRTPGIFDLSAILRRKTELASALDADWIMLADADEIHIPRSGRLLEVIENADAAGFNALEFQEFTFIPTRQAPDHDHPDFGRTMKWYYPFRPFEPHLVRAWKRPNQVDLVTKAGHEPQFPGRVIYPRRIPMKHYLYLSPSHALEKYGMRKYPAEELAKGWHRWRSQIGGPIELPDESELRWFRSDALLDAAQPKKTHYLDARLTGVPWT